MSIDFQWPLQDPTLANSASPGNEAAAEPWSWNRQADPLLNRQQDLLTQAQVFDRERRHADDAAATRAEQQHRRQLDELAAFNAQVDQNNARLLNRRHSSSSPRQRGSALSILTLLLIVKMGLATVAFVVMMLAGLVASASTPAPSDDKAPGCNDVGSHPALSVSDDGTLFQWTNPIGSCPGLEGQGFEQ